MEGGNSNTSLPVAWRALSHSGLDLGDGSAIRTALWGGALLAVIGGAATAGVWLTEWLMEAFARRVTVSVEVWMYPQI